MRIRAQGRGLERREDACRGFEEGNHNSMFLSWWEMAKEKDKELARRKPMGTTAPEESNGFLGLLWSCYLTLGYPLPSLCLSFPTIKEKDSTVEDILNTYPIIYSGPTIQ